ncbi:hypothetical protein RDABS01_003559, partial [Bienertia sinuspersici]
LQSSEVRDLSNCVIEIDEVREYTIQEVEKLNSQLNAKALLLPFDLLLSRVTGGFWLGLPSDFCRASLPRDDGMVTLVNEKGDEYPGFAEAHQLVDGDAVIFQVINRFVFKVYIIRGSGIETTDSD